MDGSYLRNLQHWFSLLKLTKTSKGAFDTTKKSESGFGFSGFLHSMYRNQNRIHETIGTVSRDGFALTKPDLLACLHSVADLAIWRFRWVSRPKSDTFLTA